jgi:drug/metabolite transporter (DMT)-like permease
VLLGALGVLAFSVTFPATTAAETSFSPVLVGVGRTAIAAVVAIAVLGARREPLLPPRAAVRSLLVVAATVGLGFGLLSALALRHVSSVHGAVLTGLIPAATAGMAVLRAGERPRAGYWMALGLGLAVVLGFAVIQGGGRLRSADVLLIVAVAVGGIGYAEGGVLAREYGGWRVICWTLVVCLPVSLPVTVAAAVASPPRHVTAGAAAGLIYVGVVSMCLGFFAWYQGLARGGLARIGRLQLAQPALTLGWSALLIGEHVSWLTAAAAAAVIGVTAVGRNARVDQRPAEGDPMSRRLCPATTATAVSGPAELSAAVRYQPVTGLPS